VPVFVGIDENGLGPRLGPLVVTAAFARADEKGERVLGRAARGGAASRLGDSKGLVKFGDSALGEAWGRAIATRIGESAETPEALVRWLSLDGEEELRRPCPEGHAAQCWSAAGESFEGDALLGDVTRDLQKLSARGVEVLGVRTCIVCTSRLNDASERGLSRFDVDLHTMERLALAVRDEVGAELDVTCGKVGGYDRYSPAFGPLAGHLHTIVEEGRARSSYAFPRFGRIAFVRDADASHLLVSLASLVGKWVRDLLMNRVVGYHRAVDPSLPVASGYHDPVTRRFVDASALSRKSRNLPDDCFERRVARK
jgi:ribonuclease HII